YRGTPGGLLTLTHGTDARFFLEGDVNDAPLVRLHRIHHYALAGAPHTIGQAQCHLLDGLLAPIAVVLDVDDQPAPVDAALVEDQIDNRLEGAKRLAPPADE